MKSISHTFIVFAILASSFAYADVDFVAYGDLRGYFEPCGCDPATDMGGVLRINSQLQRERLADRSDPGFLVLNLGNNLSDKPRDAIKNQYLLRAELVNKPDAYLLNERELTYLPKAAPRLPFVISNASKAVGASKVIDSKKALIFGYAWNERIQGQTQRVSQAMLSAWRTDAAKKKQRPAVLLFSGPDDDLKTIVDAKIFDAVVSSNTTSFELEPGKEESQDESRLVRRVGVNNVFMVPVGGQGILRGGRLTADEAKPVSAYLQKPASPFSDSTKPAVGTIFDRKVIRVTWLWKATEPGHALGDLYASYTADLTKSFQDSGKKRLAALKHSPFAGEAACATCHSGAHETYRKTAHAHAMKTLIDKNKHQDAECVACHAVGAEVEGGFVSVEESPQFANVQCENCHGPRKDHVSNPALKPTTMVTGEATCIGCHNRQHSPNFVFKTYWEKIKH